MKKLETLKTVVFDIKHSVFDNETEALMYVTKDIHDDCYIIAIPVVSFSWEVKTDKDLEHLEKFGVAGVRDRREQIVKAIKQAIKEFES